MWFGCIIITKAVEFLQIKTTAQLEAAFLFLSNVASDNFKQNEFEEACGVGM